jgi:hypothetical protein
MVSPMGTLIADCRPAVRRDAIEDSHIQQAPACGHFGL